MIWTAGITLLMATLLACPVADDVARRELPTVELRLMTLDPGHFHAALLQKEMLPGVSRRVHVYAPPGPDLDAHLKRIALFNTRRENPTSWEMEVHAGQDFLERMLKERPGNVVVLSGRNRGKIERIQAAVAAGLQVLADKPWITEGADLTKLESALDAAKASSVVAYDAMTQRFEISCILQQALVNDQKIFGAPVTGTRDDPAVVMESTHYLLKKVAGAVNLRPPWFFDIQQQGEGLTDVGTHLVDLVQWTLFPEQPLDYRSDVRVLGGRRWPTGLSRAEFQQVTGDPGFPEYLAQSVKNDRLEYYCNNTVHYTLRGIHVRLDVRWGFEAAPGAGDTKFAVFRGTRSRVEVRQRKEQNYRPEVFVVPNRPAFKPEVLVALERKVAALREKYPGLAVQDRGGEIQILIPDQHRIGHEAHFALLTSRFFEYVKDPKSLPVWEKSFMLAKYYITTKGVELARQGRQ